MTEKKIFFFFFFFFKIFINIFYVLLFYHIFLEFTFFLLVFHLKLIQYIQGKKKSFQLLFISFKKVYHLK